MVDLSDVFVLGPTKAVSGSALSSEMLGNDSFQPPSFVSNTARFKQREIAVFRFSGIENPGDSWMVSQSSGYSGCNVTMHLHCCDLLISGLVVAVLACMRLESS